MNEGGQDDHESLCCIQCQPRDILGNKAKTMRPFGPKRFPRGVFAMHSGKGFVGFCLVASIGALSLWGQEPTPAPQPPGEAKKGSNSADPKSGEIPGTNPDDPKGPTDSKMKDEGGTPGGAKPPGPVGRGIKPPPNNMGTDAPSTLPGANSPLQFGQPPSEVGGKLLREWIKDLSSTDASQREQAVRAIASFGPNAREAIPALVDRLGRDADSSPRLRALLALKYLDYYDKDVPKVVEGLIRCLTNEQQASIRFEAVQALGRFGYNDGHTAIPAVIKAAGDQHNWEIRRAAYMVLPRLGSTERGVDARVYGALINGAMDQAAMAKHEAIIALAFLGKPNDIALAERMQKTLTLVISGRDPQAEIWARVAMIGFNPQLISMHTTAILKRLKDGNFPTRMSAVRAVAMIGPAAREAVPELVGFLSDRNPEMVISACMALTSLGPEGARAADALRQLLGRNDLTPDLRQAASIALDAVTRRTSGASSGSPVIQPQPR